MTARQFISLVTAVVACMLVVDFIAPGSRAQAQEFTVEAFTSQNYTINGQSDPTLTLVRGRTYTFAVNAANHPFFIKTVAGAGTANQFTDGVSGNGVEVGTLTFTVPQTAPAQLFYQCSVHAAMSGTLTIINPLVPATGADGAITLACLLAALALLGWRRRLDAARTAFDRAARAPR